jgi:tetratricopeptide (TPR) repeat protein
MDNFKFHCPNCNQRIEAKPKHIGTHANCPACNKPLVVPGHESHQEKNQVARAESCLDSIKAQPEGRDPEVKKENLFSKIFSFLCTKSISSESDIDFARGHSEFEKGKMYCARNLWQQGLDCLDLAIECGLDNAEIFTARASCLEELDWYLDAIDDYDRAILLEPHDCNHYYQRANCKNSVGDRQGYMADIQEAIRLSVRAQQNRSIQG